MFAGANLSLTSIWGLFWFLVLGSLSLFGDNTVVCCFYVKEVERVEVYVHETESKHQSKLAGERKPETAGRKSLSIIGFKILRGVRDLSLRGKEGDEPKSSSRIRRMWSFV